MSHFQMSDKLGAQLPSVKNMFILWTVQLIKWIHTDKYTDWMEIKKENGRVWCPETCIGLFWVCSLKRKNEARPLTCACSHTHISDEHNHITLWPTQAVSSEGGHRLRLCNCIHPPSNVLKNAFSLSFLICKTILVHLDKSFNVGKMPYFPN